MSENVAILGASDKSERYSYKAFKLLQEHNHKVFPVHPKLLEIENITCYKDLGSIKEKIDTLTMYVNPTISSGLLQDIISLNPKRVIFNPGSENPDLEIKLKNLGISCESACTLVLLSTGQY